MLKSILLASTIFGLCLTHMPQDAEACGVKFGLRGMKAPGAQQAKSANPSNILIVGSKDKDLIKKLRKASHNVESVESVDDANRSNYDLVIVEKDQLDDAKDRFDGSRFVNKRSSDKATAKMAERVLAQRVATGDNVRVAAAATDRRNPTEVGTEDGAGPARNPVESAVEGSSNPVRTGDSVTTTSDPTADKPKVDKPKVDKPTVDKPKVDPTADKPKVDKPKADKPKVDKPKVDKPTVDKPVKALKWARQFQFGTNKTNLNAAAKRRLRTNAKWLEQNPGSSVLIEGHTDSVGEESYNLDLSERRANIARDFLIGLGIESSRITVEPKGELEPGFKPSTSAKNRRIVLIKQ